MSEPNHDSQQMMVRYIFGMPIVFCRKSQTASLGCGWEWTRWRMIRQTEALNVNIMLRSTWK